MWKSICAALVLFAYGASASAATLSLSPSAKTIAVGETFTVDIMLDTQGVAVDGVDIQTLNYNPSNLQVVGTQITPGSLMSDTVINRVDNGKITFAQITTGGATYTGSGKLATVTFKALTSVNANVTFSFSGGSSLDTNVASAGTDVLTSVVDGLYTITTANGTLPTTTDPVSVPAPASTPGGDVNLTTVAGAHPNQCLINRKGTYYLIIGGKRRGVANLGILYSHGYDLSDAEIANSADDSIPEGSLLLPEDGALVKKPGDPTVFLTSGGSKHGFVSESVFRALGFSFKEVLTVTGPELDAMPLGEVISDPNGRHLPGVHIKDGSTIYWLDGTGKWSYPDLTVYNSWNLNNKFSHVVPANAADRSLPSQGMATKRLICGK